MAAVSAQVRHRAALRRTAARQAGLGVLPARAWCKRTGWAGADHHCLASERRGQASVLVLLHLAVCLLLLKPLLAAAGIGGAVLCGCCVRRGSGVEVAAGASSAHCRRGPAGKAACTVSSGPHRSLLQPGLQVQAGKHGEFVRVHQPAAAETPSHTPGCLLLLRAAAWSSLFMCVCAEMRLVKKLCALVSRIRVGHTQNLGCHGSPQKQAFSVSQRSSTSSSTFQSPATMQLRQQGTLLRPATARESPGKTPSSFVAAARRTRSSVATRYQNDDDIGTASKQAQVEAEDTYRAAAANMPAGPWAGRWEGWAPPAAGFKGGLFRPDAADSSGWQLLTSGEVCPGRVRIQPQQHQNAAVLTLPPHCEYCRSVCVRVQARC